MGLWGKIRRFFRSPWGRLVSAVAQGKAAEKIVAKHWPAVEKTLREEGYSENCFKAARRACERLIEHIL